MPLTQQSFLGLGPEFLRGIDLWTVWDALRCPVLVLRGAESGVLPRGVAEEMRRRTPNVKIVEFDGVGHAPALASPEQIDAVRKLLGAEGGG